MRHNDFRQFLREYFSLTEAPLEDPVDKGETSLDSQVDRLFLSYEKEARHTKNEGKNYRDMTRRFLTEADEDAEKKDKEVVDAPKGSRDDIDVESFAESIVRLVDNYDSLLDVRDTLIRRAQEFLGKNYNPATVADFKSVMRDTFDVEVGVTDVEKQDKYQPPPAARAGKGSE